MKNINYRRKNKMSNKNKKLLSIGIATILFFQTAYSQEVEQSSLKHFFLRNDNTNETLKMYSASSEQFKISKENEIKNRTSLNENVNEGFKERFEISNDYEFRKIPYRNAQRRTCKYGFEHERYEQYYKNFKIENSDIRVRYKDGNFVGANGSFLNVPFIDVSVVLSKEDAIAIAKAHIGARKYIWEDEAESRWMQERTGKTSTYPNPELVICANMFNAQNKVNRLPRPLARSRNDEKNIFCNYIKKFY